MHTCWEVVTAEHVIRVVGMAVQKLQKTLVYHVSGNVAN